MSATSEPQPDTVSHEVITAVMMRSRSVHYPNQAPLVVEIEQADGTMSQAIVRRMSLGRMKDGTAIVLLSIKE